MKRIPYLLLLLIACNPKQDNKIDQTTELTFNRFKIGIPSDSIKYVLGFAPTRKTESQLEYYDVTFEGVRGVVDYNLAGGRLVGGTFIEPHPKAGSYDTIQTRLIRQFGKPTDQNSDTMVWEGDKASIYLTKSGNGSYLNFSRKTKPGREYKPLSQ